MPTINNVLYIAALKINIQKTYTWQYLQAISHIERNSKQISITVIYNYLKPIFVLHIIILAIQINLHYIK